MLQNCGDTQKLFAKSVTVTIKDGFTNQCRNSKLFLTVEWKEASAAAHRQELLITLTDSNDPFFLNHLHLSEEDFQVLKSSQGLLVDFSAFPQKFIDLIEVCLAEENKSSPKFLLILNTSEKVGGIAPASQLDVVETNPFKHLIHLSLKFIAATDSSVKQYLALTLKQLKEEKQHLENKLSQLEQDTRSRLTASQVALEQKTQELEKVRNDLSSQLTLKETLHARELQEERDKYQNIQREEELRHENERKEKEYSYRKEIQQLEARVSCLDSLNKELKDQNRKRDTTIQDLKSCVSSLEEEIRRGKNYIQDFKDKNQELQSELKQKTSEVAHQKMRIEELDQSSAYVKQMMNKLQEQYEKNRQHEKTVELEFAELQKEFQESRKIIKSQEKDIDKANEVIVKLQRQIQDSHAELKEMHSNSAELERAISNRDKTIRMLQKDLKEFKMHLTKKRDEVEHLSHLVASLEEASNTMEKEKIAREKVITYLNRQLIDKCNYTPSVPPCNQEQNLPLVEKRLSAGDADVIALRQSPLTAVSEKPRATSGRDGHTPSQHNLARNSPAHIDLDSAYASSPSCNAKNSTKGLDTNSNVGNFDLDSAALSAAFGSGAKPKHSTAKKFVSSKPTNTYRGRCKR